MLTPKFTLQQEKDFVVIHIHVPYVKVHCARVGSEAVFADHAFGRLAR